MLGDELKKALEPIQTSDALLEKTRRAIEEARLKQASETLAAKEAPRKNTARRSMFIKAVVPIACLLLLGFGIYFLIPKDGSKDLKKSGGKTGAIREHNKAIDLVTDEIDLHNLYENSETAEATEVTEAPENYGHDVCEDTTCNSEDCEDSKSDTSFQEKDAKASKPYTLNPSTDDDYISDYGDHPSIKVGNYIICVSDDGRSLFLKNATTMEVLTDDDEHAAPKMDLPDDVKITGLLYEKQTKTLIITVESKKVVDNGDRDIQLYTCVFKNGRVVGNEPERIG